MEKPLLVDVFSGVSSNYCSDDTHEGANPVLRHSGSMKKSEHPTLGLITPRARSSSSPLNSPRQQQTTESYLSFSLKNEQSRRTENIYVRPSYGASYFQQNCQPAVPKDEAPPESPLAGGSSVTSLFSISEDLPTTGAPQVDSVSGGSGHDLEAGILVDQKHDRQCSETCETCGNGLVNGEADPRAQYISSSSEEEEEKVPLLQQPKSGDSNKRKEQRKRHQLHKCRTAPVLSTIAGAGKVKARADTDGKKKVNEVSATGVVWQAFVGLLIYLFVGVMIYCWKKDEFRGVETVGWIDALYFCIVTMCTIGYGDITPETPAAKMLSCALVLVGFGFIDALMSGMVTFVLDRQEDMILTVVLDGRHEVAKGYVLNAEKGTMRIRLKVFLAVGTVLGSIAVGAFFLHFMENLQWIDAFYVTVISITTVGYGDYSFQTKWGRLFAALWLLLCTLGVARAFLFLAEARVQKRQRHFARKMLQSQMPSTDMVDADIDNDGHVSVSEYVVYKLKQMRKISKKDIVDIVKQFDQLDNAGVGRISMVQLLEAEAEAANESSRT